MELNIIEHDFSPDIDRGFSLSMVIKSFKGRRNVEVHLFRPEWTAEEQENYRWELMLGGPVAPNVPPDPVGSKQVFMESFGPGERDAIIEFLKKTYEDKLVAIYSAPLSFPIPLGLVPLSSVPEGKDIGIIRFEKIPSYDLGIPLHGLYDLSQHEPMA
ncbi:hypothetical protein dsx2_1847 [Desulfovibrio sp. X2]|uniref:hypothetical protein n=1 Tax=Desulfovibrio sp. X2 TaxID=941449 RepID=UPI000358844E|nr:hypothetical protein [Desulfovibrio sp. X2]EPR44103.1 hypothetical protein dsx2_1847 [Desulfovibrio sp. X2]